MNRGDTTQLTETTWQLCSRHAPSALKNNYAVRLLAVTSRLRVAYIVSSSFVGFAVGLCQTGLFLKLFILYLFVCILDSFH